MTAQGRVGYQPGMKLADVARALRAEVTGDPALDVTRLVHPADAAGRGSGHARGAGEGQRQAVEAAGGEKGEGFGLDEIRRPTQRRRARDR